VASSAEFELGPNASAATLEPASIPTPSVAPSAATTTESDGYPTAYLETVAPPAFRIYEPATDSGPASDPVLKVSPSFEPALTSEIEVDPAPGWVIFDPEVFPVLGELGAPEPPPVVFEPIFPVAPQALVTPPPTAPTTRTYQRTPAAPLPAPALRYGGFWIRALAGTIDSGLVLGPLGWTMWRMLNSGIDPATLQASIPGLGLFVAVAISTYHIALWSTGGTLGMRLLHLRIIDAHSGRYLSAGQSVLRLITIVISQLLLCIGLIWVAFDPHKQGWHDKVASTVVVRV
jgi:uncharacterized RDD family membrane protein YckC